MRCAFCKTQETELSEYGVPICAHCLDIGKPESNEADPTADLYVALIHGLTQAAFLVDAASAEVNSIAKDTSSGPPQPGCAQRIRNAASKGTCT